MGWWSIWLLVGVLCIGLELIIPGLVIIFFGFGAVLFKVVDRILRLEYNRNARQLV